MYYKENLDFDGIQEVQCEKSIEENKPTFDEILADAYKRSSETEGNSVGKNETDDKIIDKELT